MVDSNELVLDSKIRQLELAHADEGTLEDIRRSKALTTSQSQLKDGYYTSLNVVGSVASISLFVVAAYMGFSPPAAILTVINADIGPSANSALFSIIWSICAAIGIILFGRITDKFGKRWIVIAATCIGFLGGIIAATAQNFNTLVGANVLLGLAGGVASCYSLIIGEICPNKYKFLGVVLCVWPAILPTGFGAYLAIDLTHTANWRWCYYIYLMIEAAAIVLQILFYRPPNFKQLHGPRTKMEEFKRIDWVGAFLLVSGTILFLLGVSWGGEPLPWTSGRILGLLISGAVTLVAFVLYEIYSKTPNPLIPMYLFKDVRGFVCLNVIGAVAGSVYIALSILWPSQVARIYPSADPTDWKSSAWLSTTIAFGIEIGIWIFCPLVSVIKHVKIQCICLMAVMVAFLGALSTCNSSNKAQSAAFSFLAALPGGILELMPAILVQMDTDDADLGVVFSIIFFMRTALGSVFATIFVAILEAKVPVKLVAIVPPAAVKAGLPASSIVDLLTAIGAGTALTAVPGMTPKIEAAVAAALSDAFAASYAYVYYAAVAVGICGIIATLFMKDYDKLLTGHVARQIYKAGEGDREVDAKEMPDSYSETEKTSRAQETEEIREV